MGSLRDCTWILGLADYRVIGLEGREDGRLVVELGVDEIQRGKGQHASFRAFGSSSRARGWDAAANHATASTRQRRVRARPC